ncbi:MAG: hypothetical protein E4G91_07660 [Candidatus Zixiibacteriota bacterium]|nr:MAG: hypothetical protein E4G91_07660 [candidate division Zixibacteria bacterium]
MPKPLASALLLLLFSLSASAAVLSNEQLCEKGVETLADSLAGQLTVPADSGVMLLPVEGRFGQQLLDNLAARLERSGIRLYLVSGGVDSKRPVVKTTVNDYHLSYEGVHRGFFSRGRVARMFGISGASQLLGSDGRLLRSATVSTLTLCDTLSYNEARAVRGRDSFMSPTLPPTIYQRLVEPGLILGITGALVYLFFASR